jgi:hypothetical protein
VIFPLEPVAVTFFTSTFLSAKIAAATGVALISLLEGLALFSGGLGLSSFFSSAFVSFFGDDSVAGGSFDFCSFFSDGPAFETEAGFSAVSSIVAVMSPIFNVSFSLATVCKMPAFYALISKVAFSLSSSAITSSLSTQSPSFFIHLVSVTSLMLSPTEGTLISIGMYYF